MLQSLPISFDAPWIALVAALFCVAACVIAWLRRILVPRLSIGLLIAGLASLCLAAGGIRFQSAPPLRIAVMVDASGSTRTAAYHDRAVLAQRISDLLGPNPYTLYVFAEQAGPAQLDQVPSEIPSRRTIFSPVGADAIVLFSDARFEVPAGTAPTYVVVDPELEQVADQSVTRVELRDRTLSATINNRSADPAHLALTGVTATTMPAPPGETIVRAALAPDAAHVSVSVAQSDAWPENNALIAPVPPPETPQRWWMTRSAGSAPTGWRAIAPDALPAEVPRYLGVAAIALDNIAADDLTRLQHERIEQYVRDLGGGLLVLGGDRAFAAGGYAGTPIERISPLSCNPPEPATHWTLLIDSSGSMSTPIGNNSRWHFATDAITKLIALLPPRDTISVGDFARDVRWWASRTSVDQLDVSEVMPHAINPTGPTNLAPALEQLVEASDGASPTQALLITDGEAAIADAAALARGLSRKRIRVSVLSNQPLADMSTLRSIVRQTGGMDLAESDPREWAASLRTLLRAGAPQWIFTSPLNIRFDGALPFAQQSAAPWNRTWLKPNATQLASGIDSGGMRVPAIAAWNVGSGAVLSSAFTPSHELVEALAEVVATPPRDPRYAVSWDTGPQLRVTLDAIDGTQFLNELRPQLMLMSGESMLYAPYPVPQVAPGRYSISINAPRRATLAGLTIAGRAIDRIPLGERYASEFTAIGNDRAAMQQLAAQSGGAVIEPSRTDPINFPRRTGAAFPLASIFAAVAAACIAGGIVRWKLA